MRLKINQIQQVGSVLESLNKTRFSFLMAQTIDIYTIVSLFLPYCRIVKCVMCTAFYLKTESQEIMINNG